MVAGGARGTTEKELLTVLQSPSRGKLDLSSKQLMNITRMPEIKLANRLYPDKEYPLLAAFSQQVQKIYNVTLVSVDLNSKDPKSVISQINGWVSNQTNGHIKEALVKKDLDTSPNTRNALLLINCLLFDAKWESSFHGGDTHDGNTFYPDTGSPQEKKLTLMMQRGSMPYVDLTSTIGARIVHLPFKNTDFIFTIILPNKGVKLAQVESRLTSAIFNSPVTKEALIHLYMPKWKLEFNSDVMEVLKKKMKVTELFNKQKANLKGLSSKNGSFVSNILHKTYVIVDELGVRAAATSIVRVSLKSYVPGYIEFRCDKPFLYAIRYKQTTLFIGRYVKMIDISNMP